MQIGTQEKVERDITGPLTAYEAERHIQDLRLFEFGQFGSSGWMDQHERMEQLNMQAHVNAATNRDDFVLEAAMLHEKMGPLLKELIMIEVWKAKLLPRICEVLADKNNIKAYMLIYHEATTINLLSCLMYDKAACVELDELLLELVDYIYRKLVWLSNFDPATHFIKKTKEELLAETGQKYLANQQQIIEIVCALESITILRFLSDYIDDLPMGVTTRLLDSYDILMVVAPLMHQKPWQFKDENGKRHKFEQGQWREVPKIEKNKLLNPEVQLWLLLNNLVCNPELRKRYHYTDERKAALVGLRRYLHETTVDQIPNLVDLQRSIDELTIMQTPAATARPIFMLEQVVELRDRLLKDTDWAAVEREQVELLCNEGEEAKREMAKKLAEVYNMEQLDQLLTEDPKCDLCGKPAAKRCSRCKLPWYCSRECQVKNWKDHKKICDLVCADPNMPLENKKKCVEITPAK